MPDPVDHLDGEQGQEHEDVHHECDEYGEDELEEAFVVNVAAARMLPRNGDRIRDSARRNAHDVENLQVAGERDNPRHGSHGEDEDGEVHGLPLIVNEADAEQRLKLDALDEHHGEHEDENAGQPAEDCQDDHEAIFAEDDLVAPHDVHHAVDGN